MTKLSHLVAKPNELTRHNIENHGFKTNLANSLRAGYVSHFRVVFCVRIVAVCDIGSGVRFVHEELTM